MGFLSLFRGRPGSYYGKSAHKYVDKLLKAEKDLLIVSPYIDDYYADYLARHSSGKTLHIISSSIRGSAAKRLRGSRLGDPFAATFLAASVNWLLFLVGAFNFYFAFASIASGIGLLALALSHKNRIYLKIPKDFVHAKMYVGKSTAVEGSANLTYAGMHQNIENIRLITDPAEVDRLKRQFWTLWNSL